MAFCFCLALRQVPAEVQRKYCVVTLRTLPSDTSVASFSAVLLGGLVALAVALGFLALSVALGFAQVDVYGSTPLSGVLPALGLPSVIGVALGLAAGAFVAGHLAGAAGVAHGLATWGLLSFFSASVAVSALGTAANTAASATGTVVSATGSALGGAARGAGSAVGGIASGAGDATGMVSPDLLGDMDWDETRGRLEETLRGTEIPELDPATLEQDFRAAGQEVADAGRALLLRPTDAGQILDDLGTRLSARLDAKAESINRQDAVNALVANGMTPEQADRSVTEAEQILADARTSLDEGLTRARQTVEDIRQAMATAEQQAREAADAAAAAASSAGWWAFLGAILGAVIAAAAGAAGARSRETFV